jgi:hypothetical protein
MHMERGPQQSNAEAPRSPNKNHSDCNRGKGEGIVGRWLTCMNVRAAITAICLICCLIAVFSGAVKVDRWRY